MLILINFLFHLQFYADKLALVHNFPRYQEQLAKELSYLFRYWHAIERVCKLYNVPAEKLSKLLSRTLNGYLLDTLSELKNETLPDQLKVLISVSVTVDQPEELRQKLLTRKKEKLQSFSEFLYELQIPSRYEPIKLLHYCNSPLSENNVQDTVLKLIINNKK